MIAGRYRVEGRLGSGGTAIVYRALDTRLNRRVTVKLLHEHVATDAETLERFEREARAIAGLSHPNIVTVLDRGEHEGRRFIVFEYVDGGDLGELVAARGALPVRRALELAVEIGSALAYAHEHGIVHRDVKPANVLLSGSRAKVADFSIAATARSALTDPGTVLGSAGYLSPEQASGLRADERSDVYSLGVVLYELLTGDVPFAGVTFLDTARRHVEEPAPDVRRRRPDVPERVARAVARALEKSPDERFASMNELVATLRGCLAADPDADATRVSVRRAGRPRGRLPVLAVAAALVGGGLVLGLASRRLAVPHLATPNAFATNVRLTAVAAYDPPPGDGAEGDRGLSQATDGSASSFWSTEWYASPRFGNLKSGVGIVVDAAAPVEPTTLTVRSDTPGYTAVVEAGASPSGPFERVSSPQTCSTTATFALHPEAPRRYYLLWITSLPGSTAPRYQAHVNEIDAAS